MKKIVLMLLAFWVNTMEKPTNSNNQPMIVIDINQFHNNVCENAITFYFKSSNHGMYSRLTPFLKKKLDTVSKSEYINDSTHGESFESFRDLVTESIEEAFIDREVTINDLRRKKKIILFANFISAILAGTVVFIADYMSRDC